MKKTLIILSLLAFLLSCSDTDHNPWKGEPKPPIPGVIEKSRGNLADGISVLSDDSMAFVLYAPHKSKVQIIGEFNNWNGEARKWIFYKDGDYFWTKIGGLESDKEYLCQYLIDDNIRVADPYASKISDPWNDSYITADVYPNMIAYPEGKTTEVAMVVSMTKKEYQWQVPSFNLENKDNMVIYELLIRDFTEEQTIKAATAKITYLKELGVDAVELMPFNEFEGNQSWGYNPSFYFATDKAYGTEQDYKYFIDECHKNGIAVIMDMVLNHSFGQAPMVRMYANKDWVLPDKNPYYNVSSPNQDYHWGFDFNHEAPVTQQFVDSVNAFWLKEFKIDGFRFDFTKGFTNTPGNGWNYDAKRIKILKRMTDQIRKRKDDAIIILEHLTDNKEEIELANYGIYLWGNMQPRYKQVTMGWENNNLNWTSYLEREWKSPKLIAYMESHDEERIMFETMKHGNSSNTAHDVKTLNVALARAEAAAVIYFSFPGPKMVWQFGEMGYDIELGDDRLAPKPTHWEYLDVAERKSLHNVYQQMIELRKMNDAFASTNFEANAGEGLVKQILLRGTKNVVAVANFNVEEETATVVFEALGSWTDHFTGENLNVTTATANIILKPGEYRLYIQN